MTYYYSSTKNYEFTAFSEGDLGGNVACGTKFSMPNYATTCITVKDNDIYLSGDSNKNENADDSSYQTAAIDLGGSELGNGGQIYAESYWWVHDQHGNWYVMIEIEQEGSSDDYFTFWTGDGYRVPADGAELTVHSECNVKGDWIDYKCLSGGDKAPETGWIKGRLTYDADCNDNEWNDETGKWDEGVAGKTVQLLDLAGNVVATSVTDSYGNYMFDVAAGDYRVKFPELEGYKFSAKDSGVDDHFDSDADANGLTDIISVVAGQTIANVDAGIKEAGSIEGRIFCDLDCDGLDGSSTVVPGKEYTMEAEGMNMYNFCKVNGSQASEGELVKLKCAGTSGDLWKNFGGDSGTYDLTIYAQDESDGQSTIMVKVNGHVVGTIKLDRDNDGAGDDNGEFSAFVLEDIQINAGDKVQLWVDGKDGEFVRIDKIEFQGEDSVTTTVEPPKAGVEVKLLDADGNVVATTTTDAEGNYKFSGLPDGDYQVMATLPSGQVFTLKDVDGNVSDDVDSDVDSNGMSDTISIVDGGKVTDVDAGLCEAGSIAGRVFCDLDCNGLDGTSSVVPGKEYTMEAEGMHMYNFCTVNGSQASGGQLVKLKCAGGNGDLWKDFGGESGTYDLTVFVQDENDGQSVIMVKVNGEVVGTIKLDRDSDGPGSNHDGFSQFTLEDIAIAHGDKVQLWVDGKGGEFVRVDKIEFKGEDSTTTTAEPPKAGVEVKLVDASGAVVATTTTDADGNYKFDSVPDGDYKVMVTLPDGQEFTLQDVNGNANDDIDSDVNGMGMTDTITISGGNDVTDIDAGLCEVKAGSLSGRYFCDTNGDDVDDNNGDEPGVAGVLVTLLDATGAPARDVDGNLVASVETAADGTYSFGNLAAGSYTVQFTDPNAVLAGKELVAANDPNGNGDDTSDSDAIGNTTTSLIENIQVVAGANTPDNDAGVRDLPGSLSGRYFMDNNDNDVDDAGDMGIQGVQVELVDANGPTGITTTTDVNGNYSFTGLAAGTYGVIFTDPNGVLVNKSLVDPNDPNGNGDDTNDSDATGNTTTSTINNIVVNAGQNTPDNDAGAENLPGSLSGRYFMDNNDNDVDDAGDMGINGVRVELLDFVGFPTGFVTFTATVNGVDGYYEFTGLPEGTFGVRFTDPNGVLVNKSLVAPNDPNGNGDDTNDSDAIGDTTLADINGIVVNPGQNTPDNDAGAENLPGSLSGRYFMDNNDNDVDDAGDMGIQGVQVELVDANGPTGITTTTDVNGNYSFAGLAAGTYGVIFTDPNGVLTGKTLVDPNDPNGNGDDTNDSDATGNTTTSTINNIVVNAGQNTPDNDAGAENLPGSLSGRYFMDNNDNDVDDAGDMGINGVRAELLDGNGFPTGLVTFTATVNGVDGYYEFTGLPEGTFGVRFTDPNGVLVNKSLVAPNDPNGNGDDTNDSDAIGDTTLADINGIVVNPGQNTPDNDAGAENLPGSLSGRYFMDNNDNDVDDAGDMGIQGVQVELVDANGPTGITTTTDVNGNYSFAGLAAGTYGVIFTDPNGVLTGKTLVDPNDPNGNGDDTNDSDATGNTTTSTINNIVVNAGQNTPDNDAGAENLPGSLSGRYFMDNNDNDVDDAGDMGIQGVQVELVDANGPTGITTTTDVNGNYSFSGLAAGTYGVIFTDPNGVLTGKTLVDPNDPNGNGDDTNDSDATGNTTTSTINNIVVNAGQNTPDNDAGAENLPGSLSGRYFMDNNDNDVDDAGDMGIQGVQVELVDANGPTGITTTTDVNGNYSFAGLAAGTYGVIFTDPNGVLTSKTLVDPNDPNGNGDDTNDSDATGNTTTSTINNIVVNAGQNTPDNDAGAENLPGSLSGRYFMDNNDNDVDDAGDMGIQGVQVELVDANGPTGITTTTDVNGNYSFTGLAAGTYGVIFTDPNGVLVNKSLVDPNDPNGNGDDTNDSDATGNTTTSTINDIVVNAGQNTPDNDAGAENLPGSLSGRYFMDNNDNDVFDAGDMGIQGVQVELVDANGPTGITTFTGVNGNYSFSGLAAGTYGVIFTDPNGVLVGKTLVDPNDPNGNGDDTNDSDAIGDTITSAINNIVVNPGQETANNDAGAELPNRQPEPTPDEAKICYDEAIAVDVLTNDTDPDNDNLTIKAINGDLIGVNDPKLIDGVEVTLNADGTLTFNAFGKDGPMGHLLAGEMETRQYTYTVDDGNGGMATTTVDVTFCGATDTIEKVFTLLPGSVEYQVRDENKDQDGDLTDFDFTKGPDAFTVNVIDASAILAGTFVSAYCLSYNDAVSSIAQQDAFAPAGSPLQLVADVKLADADSVGDGLAATQIGINGETAKENLDLINWIINQRFETVDNGDGTPGGETYTDFEIQAAIWALTDGQDLAARGAVGGIVLSNDNGAYGTKANAQEIVDAAIANGEGFVADAAAGDLVGVFLDADNQPPAENVQPFIVGYDLSYLFEDCIC